MYKDSDATYNEGAAILIYQLQHHLPYSPPDYLTYTNNLDISFLMILCLDPLFFYRLQNIYHFYDLYKSIILII